MKAGRTCVACRESAERAELIRLVARPDTGEVVVDYRAALPGRGSWVHPRRSCVERVDRRVLARALRRDDLVLDDLPAAIRSAVVHALGDGLSIAASAGELVGGYDALVRSLRGGDVAEVVVAHDAAERTAGGLRREAGPDVAFTEVPWDADALGKRVGQGARAALGVLSGPASRHLRRQLRRLRHLG